MKNPEDGLIKDRLKSIGFALKGIWLLITTETSIKIQIVFTFVAILAGFYFKISALEWMIQILVIGLVLIAEAVNTAIEKVADFIHPAYHKKIEFIKDVGAAAPGIAAIISLIIAGIIYIPKIG
ncbi:diacylglycerol kinase family protein [Tenacibaculum sp. UWU-22]|uniref:diacylglycerol kinase family protein n=1 Tax=Tenacibaculum sp. UWU-22 TaxID=3234187 RepID=UPI0034DB3FB9